MYDAIDRLEGSAPSILFGAKGEIGGKACGFGALNVGQRDTAMARDHPPTPFDQQLAKASSNESVGARH
jgi:hypothetical protein